MSHEEFEFHPHFVAGAVVTAVYTGWYLRNSYVTPSLPEKLAAMTMWGAVGGCIAWLNPWFMVPASVMMIAEESPITITWKEDTKKK